MNLDDLEPLPEEMQLLLRGGRPGAEPPAGAKAAMGAFLAAHAAVAGVATAAAPGASAAAPGTTALKTWSAIKGSFGVGGLMLGAAVGAAGHAAYVSHHETRAPAQVLVHAAAQETVVPANALPPWVLSAPSAETVAPPTTAPPRAARDARDDGKSATDISLSIERALVDMARTAVARGDGVAALPTLEKHARDFPHGRLAEEREWLMIQALVAAGRGEEARARGVMFRRLFPRSLMLPALDHVLAESAPASDAGAAAP